MITIYDVAKKAGVSKSTVSLVLNKSSLVKKQTREKVSSAIAKTGYKPNVMAQSLVTRKTRIIGLLVPGELNPFFDEIVSYIEHGMKEKDFILFISRVNGDEDEERIVEAMLGRRVEGIICLSSTISDDGINTILQNKIPLVLYDRTFRPHNLVSCILINIEQATKQVLEYFLRSGHKRIGFLSAAPNTATICKRKEEYMASLKRHGITWDKKLMVECAGSIEGGYRGVEKLLRLRPVPTAIFATNDEMAIGAMRHIHEKGLRVPEDVSVAGFDDIYLSRYLIPSLTTVSLSQREIADTATEYIFKMLRKEKGCTMTVKHKFVVRKSTKKRK